MKVIYNGVTIVQSLVSYCQILFDFFSLSVLNINAIRLQAEFSSREEFECYDDEDLV